jgi:hypothetical protein
MDALFFPLVEILSKNTNLLFGAPLDESPAVKWK